MEHGSSHFIVEMYTGIYMWCKHTAEHASSADKHERRWTVGWSKHCLEKHCRVWRGVLPLISAGNSAGKSKHIVTWLRLFSRPQWHYQNLNRILRPCVNTRCNMALFGHWSLIVASGFWCCDLSPLFHLENIALSHNVLRSHVKR